LEVVEELAAIDLLNVNAVVIMTRMQLFLEELEVVVKL
jgi:hypothetical protein